ncbi:Lin0512_fam domain-containing protein [Cephalotus follicularis]|uniref:Lin0512_fam domain-containing protein n=1 Tax=Cephalotus follicularis TaxID=3775 RepID=A0A1Q3ANM7_CEPFO|nr:Lin0512_fam domain-containing protein [Cephalotus follicularis]
MSICLLLQEMPFLSFTEFASLTHNPSLYPAKRIHFLTKRHSLQHHLFSPPIRASITAAMEPDQSGRALITSSSPPIKLLFVEMGVGYDQHGQDVTAAAMRACRDAISSNSIPAFRRGSIPGVSFEQMKLQIKLGVPHSLQQTLDIESVKSVFPYGEIVSFEVVDGGLICSSGVYVEEMGDKNDDCYIVNAAVYVGY